MAAGTDPTKPDSIGEVHSQERDDAALIHPPVFTRTHSNHELRTIVEMLLLSHTVEEARIVGLSLYHRKPLEHVAHDLSLTAGRTSELLSSLQLRAARARQKHAADLNLARMDRAYKERQRDG